MLLFQPAEENGEGAKGLIDDGALDDPKALAVFGLHGWPDLESGFVAVHRHAVMASVDNFEIRIQGKGGHGAMPHQTRDPIITAAQLITAAQSLVSRRTAPLDSSVITFGRIQGGKTHNVIPASCSLWGTIRTLDAEVRQNMRDQLETLCRNLGEAFETPIALDWQETCPATVNDPAMADLARTAAEKALGPDAIRDIPPSMGGEDFSYFLERYPGAYFWLGLGKGQGPLHNPRFDFNDESLETGIKVFLSVLEEASIQSP
jgi:amidohydrolase